MTAVRPTPTNERPAAAARVSRRWLLLVHQLPSKRSNLRVRTWRRMQQLGAIAVKQAVYALPDSAAAREDFEWLKTEIASAGGEASVFAADSVDAWSDDALVEEFRRSSQQAFADLAGEVERALRRLGSQRPRTGPRRPADRRALERFRRRLAAIEQKDFFGSAGRDGVVTLLERFAERLSDGSRPPPAARQPGENAAAYRARMWVTRPRPGIDRMASAWLIRRFIDPEARFGFVQDRAAAPRGAVPFDMFGVEFTHQGEHCTFETLCERFGIRDPSSRRLAAIVHDLDLKDGRFGAPEVPTVGMLVEGLQLAYAEDDALLAQGIVLFEALYRSAHRATQPTGPRPVARHRGRRGGRSRPRGGRGSGRR